VISLLSFNISVSWNIHMAYEITSELNHTLESWTQTCCSSSTKFFFSSHVLAPYHASVYRTSNSCSAGNFCFRISNVCADNLVLFKFNLRRFVMAANSKTLYDQKQSWIVQNLPNILLTTWHIPEWINPVTPKQRSKGTECIPWTWGRYITMSKWGIYSVLH